jgi:uncharacterized protein
MLLPPEMSPHEFSFPATELDAGGKHFQLPIRAGWLRGVLEGTDIGAGDHDGELDLRLSKSGTDVVVRGTISASLLVPCSRCLAPTVVTIREVVSALAVPGAPGRASGARDGGDEEGGVEEADVIPFDGENLILDDLVRDELLLGIPMIPLCSEACPGIRHEPAGERPGADGAEIDPRLRPLLRLKNNSKT